MKFSAVSTFVSTVSVLLLSAGADSYTATIANSSIAMTVKFYPGSDANTVAIDVQATTGLTPSMGPYTYHIHLAPVNNASCATTLGHWNPTGVNYTVAAGVSGTLSSFEAGDLSGKFGKIPGSADGSFSKATYMDPTIAISGMNSITGKSVTVHNVNGTRIACANIMMDSVSSPPATPGSASKASSAVALTVLSLIVAMFV